MDPSNLHPFITLIPSSMRGQAPPLPPRILQGGAPLQSMVIPITASDVVMSSAYAAVPSTISMTTASAPLVLPVSQTHPPLISVPIPAPVKPHPPPVNLYKCATGAPSYEVSHSASERTKEKASLDILQQAYQELNSRKIKDPLSSFLPGIPGDFDNSESQETMLLDLVEHKPIGGKEFLPLSGQALLGFRLLPGPLPEQLRIDPPTSDQKPRKKRKHKHRNIDRTEDKTDTIPAPQPTRMPTDAYSFIKSDHLPGVYSMGPTPEPSPHIISNVGASVALPVQLQPQTLPRGPVAIAGQPQPVGLGFDKKKKKKNKDRDRKKKEKKKKKHHTQDPSPHTSHSSLTAGPHTHPPPPSTTHFSHPHP